MTFEEQQAIVDEAHRQGVRVACTAHAGIAVRQSIDAGCDSLELGIDIDPDSIRQIVDKGLFMTFALTINKNPSRQSVREIQKASFQRALKAGAKIVFAVNATGAHGKQAGPYHGEEAVEFATMVEYGMTPLQAIEAATAALDTCTKAGHPISVEVMNHNAMVLVTFHHDPAHSDADIDRFVYEAKAAGLPFPIEAGREGTTFQVGD